MTTMMQHPKHGKHPAVGHEIEGMKANGWTICPPKMKAVEMITTGPVTHVLPIPAPSLPEATPAPRRRGPNKTKA